MNGQVATEKEDGVNKILDIVLEQGEYYQVDARLVESQTNEAKIRIKVTFTPDEISLNQAKTVTLNPNETKYYSFIPSRLTSYDISITSSSQTNLVFSMTFGDHYEGVITSSTGNINSSFIMKQHGRYYIQITNTSTKEEEVTIVINDSETINFYQSYSFNDALTKIYRIEPQFTSHFRLITSGDYNMEVSLYNETFEEISTQMGRNVNLMMEFVQGQTYYIEIKPSALMNVVIDFQLVPQVLNVGVNQHLTKETETKLYGFQVNETSATFFIQSQDVTIEVYNSIGMRIDVESEVTVTKNEFYYIIVTGERNQFEITIKPITNYESDVYTKEGYAFIEYKPERTGHYLVDGDMEIEWYTNELVQTDHYLYAGYTYYLKVKGEPNKSYHVNIHLEIFDIDLNVTYNLYPGYYQLLISKEGAYQISSNSNDGEINLDLYDSTHQLIYMNLTNDPYQLNEGVYYLDIKTSNHHFVTLAVTSEDGTEPNEIPIRLDGRAIVTEIAQDQSKTLSITPSVTEDYYLHLAWTKELNYELIVYYEQNGNTVYVPIEVVEYTPNLFGDAYHQIIVKVSLEADLYYRIGIKNKSDEIIRPSIRITIPSKLQTIKLGDQLIFDNGTSKSNIEVDMGQEYQISYLYNTNATVKSLNWMISPSNNPNGFATQDILTLTLGYHELENNQLILIFMDEFSFISVTLIVINH